MNNSRKIKMYAAGNFIKELFKTKDNMLPGWTPIMNNMVNTMRKVGSKYTTDIEGLQKATSAIPKPLARLGSGIGKDKVKIYKNEDGEWYIPIRIFKEKTKTSSYETLISTYKPTIMLYLHGGAMCLCSNKSHREMLLRLSNSSNMIILAVNYRKPPEHPFPVPQNDCYTSYLKMIDSGLPIVLAGDSAGGNLALTITQRLIREKKQMPESILLISPWVNLTENATNIGEDSSILRNSQIDFLPINGISLFAKSCIQNNESLDNKTIMNTLKQYSPSYYNLTGYPDIYMFTGKCEMLIDQQRAFVKRARQYNVNIKYIEEANMIHAYPLFASLGVRQAKDFFLQVGDIYNP